MITSIFENNQGLSIELTPETVEEYSQLLRATNNAKKIPPEMYLTFSASNSKPSLNIWLKKVEPGKQINSISLTNNNRK